MFQGSLFQPQSLSVTDITRYLRELMDSDEILRDVRVSGEVSNPSYPASGHLYFTLKDQGAALKCVMWKPQVLRLHFRLEPGMALEAHGAISVYEQGGQYQLYVDSVRQVGEGALYQEFLHLKDKLEAEGLFDPERKRAIPAAPAWIGIVTSPSGAALHDILNTLQRRYPLAEVIIAPAAVQGDAAPGEIVAALNKLNALPNMDVILLARGGGSLEDLWSFNDERVVRAVVNSRVPIISGVGHETDFTLTDFAADLRAPTPTAAAELATPDREELAARVYQLDRELNDAILARLDFETSHLSDQQRSLERSSPLRMIQERQQRLDELTARISLAGQGNVGRIRARHAGLSQVLASLNPEAVLQRGYAIVRTANGEVIRRTAQAIPQSRVTIKVSDGEFNASVAGKDEGESA
jgi:exodeoxyribonuclease VII large subunit